MKNIIVGLVLIGLLSACSSSDKEGASENQQLNALHGAINQPLERAKGVEQQILEGAEERKKQVEAQSQ